MMGLLESLRAISLVDIVCMVCLCILGVFWLRVHLQLKRSSRDNERERILIKLEDICPVWTRKDGEMVRIKAGRHQGIPLIKIENLAPLWRDPEETGSGEEEIAGPVVLKNPRAAAFYQAISGMDRKHLNVCGRLLKMLDNEGGCASVVSQQALGDLETSWDSKTYQKLGRITLLDHTLNVAEAVIDRLTADDAKHIIPDGVVAALGHDIGKIPSRQPVLYSMGDHPLTSADLLGCLSEFIRLSKKAEILNAVKLHHKDSDDYLAKVIKQADQHARQAEIDQVNTLIAEQETESEQSREPDAAPFVAPEPVLPPAGQPAAVKAAWKAQRDIYGVQPTDAKVKKSAKEVQIPDLDISGWFDGDKCLQQIKTHINVIKGSRFKAFSMPVGVVYIQSGLLRDIVLDQAKKAEVMDIALRDKNNNSEMQPVLLAAVNHFRARNMIAAEIQEKYFGGYFNVICKDGKTLKGFYTPFNAEAFLASGESLGELEQRKHGRLLNFTSVEIETDDQE